MAPSRRSIVLGISPFCEPDSRLVAALCRAGALGVLDIGHDRDRALHTIAETAHKVPEGFGIRIPEGVELPAGAAPKEVRRVVLPAGANLDPWRGREILVQVTSVDEAMAAISAGADALILRGSESGGRAGDESAFVLLQRLAGRSVLPLWVQGGIGLHTAAACLAGGAVGVVLDSQLALVREAATPAPIRDAISAMDGSETTVIHGYRVYHRPDLELPRRTFASPAEVAERLGGRDLATQLLPAGQDAAFAKELARRYHTAGSVAHAITEAAREQLLAARAHRPLEPGGGIAPLHGARYPIMQGPMTRVSDRAAFAHEVARAGGLPFLALSLMRGAAVRDLLADTAERLGDLPWGVGILGFVPADLREEQLEVVREFNPPLALIAGGRPSQARPLEERGIACYLHVPSPGLLDLFLADGARRFVFEGRECGGHVGPRSSFALWEAQIQRLLRFDAPEELSVVFAGGIHDGRSAAMVAAMAAPLAARGAKIGVLMGTAYLFTEEAVATGAIQPGFQEMARACQRTALLETAPGHATRCVETDYVEFFRAERTRLESTGADASEMWAELERLNLGRLRIASKGLRREGESLVPVSDGEQRRDGMYMIGQVAALRTEVTTIEELHREVSQGATTRIAELEMMSQPAPQAPADVAIVGIACVFPGAADTDAYWANVVGGRNSITEVPGDRWNASVYFDPDANGEDKTNSKWGGFLSDVPFDPLRYGIPPRSLVSIEPSQLLSLEIAKRALDDAGYADREFDRRRTSVIFGAEAGNDLAGAYGFRALFPQYFGSLPEPLADALPALTEDSFPGVLGNVISGRIANRLDLGGVNYTVDAACASSLAAVDLAVKELCGGTSDMVLCGGVDLHNSINDYLMFSSVHALSRHGQCRTFDSSADGIVLGEGVAALVLKRLADAERDGDRIYAVIKAVAGSSDGRCLGLTAPRKEGQMLALARAYARAGFGPEQVGAVEAHGTGTVVGDRTELATLTEVFQAAGTATGSVALGSVKSQIGHTKCAAGLAGLIKMALSLYHRVLPPTLHIREPNPYWDPAQSPFVFSERARPWTGNGHAAAVSAFGFGGTNFHAVLSAYERGDGPEAHLAEWPAELFLLRGEDALGAKDKAKRLLASLDGPHAWRLRDLARTVSAGDAPVQIAIVASDLADLAGGLASAIAEEPDEERVFCRREIAGETAFLFPGQGSQRPGMLADLFVAFPTLRGILEIGERWTARMFPPVAFGAEARREQRDALTDTRVAQPALGMADLALNRILESVGVTAQHFAGHSYGELVALTVAGALEPAELLELSQARGECILAAAAGDPGTMAAVSGPAPEVEAALGDLEGVVIANYNAPEQTVLAGSRSGVEAAVAALDRAGLRARAIPVACAFHSPIVAGASDTFATRLAEARISAPRPTVWSNTTASPYPDDPDQIRARLAEHIAKPVRFSEQIEAMYEAGVRTFVEAGPGRVLSGLVSKILGSRPHLVVACDEPGEAGLPALQRALAALACGGAPVDVEPLHAGRGSRLVDLDHPEHELPAPSSWLVNGMNARPLSGELPAGALRPVTEPLPLLGAGPSPSAEEDGVVLEYLRGMREVVTAQREVMLRFLGERAPAARGDERRSPSLEPAQVVDAELIESEREPEEAKGIQETLLDIVSERTGYPLEMLDLDLDLEADLSIDSIKRIEVLGVLSERLHLDQAGEAERDDMIEQLASHKTLRGIIDWLEAQAPQQQAQPPEPRPQASVPEAVRRFVLAIEPAPAAHANGTSLEGRMFALTDDGRGVATELARRLEVLGARTRVIGEGEDVAGADGIIHLAALGAAPSTDAVKSLFRLTKGGLAGGASLVYGASALGGLFGRQPPNGAERPPLGGVAGLLKSVAKENAEARIRAVDLDPGDDAPQLAEHLLQEILSDDALVEVGYRGGLRQQLRLVAEDRPKATGQVPVLDGDSVVLLTGGARGITARVARNLAEQFGCRLELVGRSPVPGPEDPRLAEALDAAGIRRALIESGTLSSPAEIERACSRILADREIRGTLEAIASAGARARYHAVDVRDDEAFASLIAEIYEKHGRIDGVIHGAGVIEDKLLKDKTAESFARVFDTKVASALTLSRSLRDGVRFVVFFSSVSGAFGNRGQADYAAANDFLDKLAWWLRERFQARVISVDWGPWAETGMVSPELEREYARRGVGLIPPESGVHELLEEIALAATEESQVILMRADGDALAG